MFLTIILTHFLSGCTTSALVGPLKVRLVSFNMEDGQNATAVVEFENTGASNVSQIHARLEPWIHGISLDSGLGRTDCLGFKTPTPPTDEFNRTIYCNGIFNTSDAIQAHQMVTKSLKVHYPRPVPEGTFASGTLYATYVDAQGVHWTWNYDLPCFDHLGNRKVPPGGHDCEGMEGFTPKDANGTAVKV